MSIQKHRWRVFQLYIRQDDRSWRLFFFPASFYDLWGRRFLSSTRQCERVMAASSSALTTERPFSFLPSTASHRHNIFEHICYRVRWQTALHFVSLRATTSRLLHSSLGEPMKTCSFPLDRRKQTAPWPPWYWWMSHFCVDNDSANHNHKANGLFSQSEEPRRDARLGSELAFPAAAAAAALPSAVPGYRQQWCGLGILPPAAGRPPAISRSVCPTGSAAVKRNSLLGRGADPSHLSSSMSSKC